MMRTGCLGDSLPEIVVLVAYLDFQTLFFSTCFLTREKTQYKHLSLSNMLKRMMLSLEQEDWALNPVSSYYYCFMTIGGVTEYISLYLKCKYNPTALVQFP